MALTKVTYSMIDGPTINVKDYGIVPAATDNLAALTSLIANAPVGATLLFPPGTYNVSAYVPVLRSSICLLGGPGVVINNTNVSAGYPSDGIRVGNAAAAEGEGGTNTSPYTYLENIFVDGLTFTNCRIGLWFVYCKNFVAQNIQANSTAAVACGNDAYDDCENFELRNITQISWSQRKGSADFYIVGIYRCNNFSVDNVYQLDGMTGPANASAIDINESNYFSLTNAHLNQFIDVSNGITLAGCKFFNVSGCSVINAKSGFVTFPRNGITEMLGSITDCSAISCTNGVQVFGQYTTFENIYTNNCTYDLALQTDAGLNTFNTCQFNPTGSASIFQEIPTGNNGINLQRWRNCTGGVLGTANGYFGGLSTSFRAIQSAGLTDVTGGGANVTVTNWVEEYESNNGTNMFDPTNGVFTAPITGLYRFEMSIELYIDTSGFTFAQLSLILSNGSLSPVIAKSYTSTNALLNGSVTVQMARGSTAHLSVVATGGTNHADIPANGSLNYWSGMLVA